MKAHLKSHFVKTLKKRAIVLAYVLLAAFLIANAVLSQIVSPLYVQVAQEGGRTSAIAFLKAIRSLPIFEEQLALYKNVYDPGIEQEIFAEDSSRKALINRLEQILKNNPSQRDVLYSLYLLYSDKGDTNQAHVYYELAKEVDPLIK